MKYTQAEFGRTFIIRLEDHDKIPDAIEDFAKVHQIKAATVLFLGGAKKDSKVVVGPEDGAAKKPVPMVTTLSDASEALGVGTIFMNEQELPKLHLHSAFGRKDKTITGCTREGVDIWHIGEVIITELINSSAMRKIDPGTGFELLDMNE
jgi:predicted DNA-binding protein with PD1-like motif